MRYGEFRKNINCNSISLLFICTDKIRNSKK